MNCMVARQKLGALIHERLRADQSAALRRHLLACDACHDEYEYQARLSSPLRDLAPVEPPADLAIAIRLRVSTPRPSLWDRLQLSMSHWMRPVALPAAGGLLTALILFGMLVPAVGRIRVPMVTDVPTALSTDPRFKQASILPVSEDLLVEAWIDEQGKVSGIQVLNAAPGEAATVLDSQIGEVLLTTSFEPATRFGQRTSGKVLLSLRRITIRG
jgi:hypothetical protein